MDCLKVVTLHELAAGAEPTAAQTSHLSACGDCRAALEAARADAALAAELAAAVGDSAGARANAAGELPQGTRIGEFTIRRAVGIGGMGVVYEAVQDAPRRAVALKLIKTESSSPGVLRRFEHEAAALALLQHPGIAQVYQAGIAPVELPPREPGGVGSTLGPRPFMAMELVEGPSLDAFVRDGAPTLREKLELLARIADAADHAHRRGVIHRDLKPSNVLIVTGDRDGAVQPKILDFGIAKFRDDGVGGLADGAHGRGGVTHTGAFIGTLAYASPEQVSGDPSAIDARTDVYALGVILYRMVTGTHPYALDGSLAEAVEVIKHAKIMPPKKQAPRLDADLVIILQTALAADPSRRYRSAAALAEDVRRFLDKRPIRARPDSTVYVLKKAIARHPYRALTAAAVAIGVIASGVSLGWLTVRAARADRAKSLVLDATYSTFGLSNPDDPDTPLISTVEELLAESKKIIQRDLAEHPEERALLMWRLGQSMIGQRRSLEEGAATLEQVVAYRRDDPGPNALPLADALVDLGRARFFQGRVEEANGLLHEALEIRRRELGPRHPDTIDATYWLGASLHGWRRYAEAEEHFAAAVNGLRAVEPDSLEVGEYLTALAACQRGQGRYEPALATAREALAHIRRIRGEDAKHCAPALSNIIANLISLRRYDEAEPLLAESLRLRMQWYGENDPRVADTLVQFASLNMRRADAAEEAGDAAARDRALDDGIDYATKTLRLRQSVHAGDHEQVAEALSLLGQLLMRRGDLFAAREQLQRAMEMRARLPRESDGDLGRSESNLGECLRRMGGEENLALAERLSRSGHERVLRTYGARHRFTLAATDQLARVCEARGLHDEAASLRAGVPEQKERE